MSPDLGDYRIVHFATHSLLNNEHPELSGVVLVAGGSQRAAAERVSAAYDIYNLRLGADLVVLSACRTALGQEIKGEGLIGLTRGFLYAGAPRVVATLWEIDDRTTAEAMKRFYEGMLGRGERPAEAFRAAQIALWRSQGLGSALLLGGVHAGRRMAVESDGTSRELPGSGQIDGSDTVRRTVRQKWTLTQDAFDRLLATRSDTDRERGRDALPRDPPQSRPSLRVARLLRRPTSTPTRRSTAAPERSRKARRSAM